MKNSSKRYVTFNGLNYMGDGGRTLTYHNKLNLPFSVDMQKDLFKMLLHNPFFTRRGSSFIKGMTLDGLIPWDPSTGIPPLYGDYDAVPIHGLIRVCNLTSIEDYLEASNATTAVKELENITFPIFKIKSWRMRALDNKYIHLHQSPSDLRLEGDAVAALIRNHMSNKGKKSQ